MKMLRALLVTAGLLVAAASHAQPADATDGVVKSAEAFLSTLSAEQRKQVSYAYGDEAQRARWSNFPTGFVKRGGIALKQMSPAQHEAAMHLLAQVLSPMGLEKVEQIRQADDDFKANGSKRGPRGGNGGVGGPPPGGGIGRSGGPGGPGGPGAAGPGASDGPRGRPNFSSEDMFGGELYYLSILGVPSKTSPWMLQFGGHHLALNITIDGDKGVLTPSLTGAQPAMFTRDGKTVRPLGRESDKALALLQSLSEAQRHKAVLGYKVADLVLGPGQDGKTIVPDGLKASDMSAAQQALLMDVISEWADIASVPFAAARVAQLRADLRDTWFAWSGPVDGKAGDNINAYYRVQGPHLVIEYAPQSDEPGNHVHTIYRDPTNDYGRAPARP